MRAALVVMVLVARTAFADPDDRSGLPDDGALHSVIGAGLDLGTIHAGAMTSHGGVHALFGVRISRVAVLGEVGVAPTTANADETRLGCFARGAFEARVSLWQDRVLTQQRRYSPPFLVRGDVWLGPGIGYELATQTAMPALARPDVSLAIGYEETNRASASWTGGYVAVRVMAAAGGEISALVMTGVALGN